jgi:hypothetical protein
MKPKTCLLQQKNYKHARIGPTRYLLTPPKAMDATPLPNPTTETGVVYHVPESPICRKKTFQQQVTASATANHEADLKNRALPEIVPSI